MARMIRGVDRIADIPIATWRVLLEAAPWLLFGLVVAGMLRAFLPDRLVARWLGGRGIGSVIRAAIIGTPLPLCSCGVVPTAIGLRRQGASKPSTISFLIATPENGADSIALTYALMGPVMAIARPVAALVSAVAAGVLALLVDRSAADAPADPAGAPACACCAKADAPPPEPSCCASESSDPHPGSPWARLAGGIRYAFSTLLDDLVPWLALGLVLAGALAALVPPDAMAAWGRGPLAMLAMAVIGVPIYVCATAFTPVGASLLIAGVSPGAVLVLLLAGPATNLGTIGVVRRELGTRALVAYLSGVIGVAIASGLALDAIVGAAGIRVATQASHAHHLIPFPLSLGAAAILFALALRPLRRALFGALGQRRATDAAPATEHTP